ncbi:MAG: tetratricopeptide repeat protein [Acidiferrobacterales bacterium]|nr:tetratricopeptide repeat protein [Acidiferrobacterales bacterium]
MAEIEQALTHQKAGRLREAEETYRQILAQEPGHVEALHWLGVVALQRGQYQAAIELIGKALERKPEYVAAHNNIGLAWQGIGELEHAGAAFRQALLLAPEDVDIELNLVTVLFEQSKLSEAAAICQQAIAQSPNVALAHSNLGAVRLAQAQHEAAIASLQKAVALEPHDHAHSNVIQAMHYHPNLNAAALFAEARRWHEQYAAPLRTAWVPHDNPRDPERRLRLGYVSADLRRHPVGWFMEPVMAHHDRTLFEIFCYASVPRPDRVTDQFRSAADHWCDALSLSDTALAEKVREDRIDILVDLSGHTRGHRLLSLARKPAPVQVTAGGHYSTTGLEAIDYLIADRFHAPEGVERYFSETLIRMPHDYICYGPPVYAPAVAALPALRHGYVTFGCYNNLAKINERVVALWSEILKTLPGARLRLQTRQLNDPPTRAHVRELFAARGIGVEQLEFHGHLPHEQLLAAYAEIDIALDPFPYSGGLTTLEALWMGVPVITLTGQTFCGRHSTSHLNNVGLSELVTTTPEDYVRVAVALAQDIEHLRTLRATLREQMAASPLSDTKGYTQDLEAAYREIWRKYCEASSKSRVK